MVTNAVDRLSLAVRALVVLATTPRGMATSEELAEALGAHAVIIRRLLGPLRSDGVVESRRGHAGGWALARDPATITLGRVCRALDGGTVPGPGSLDEALARAREAYLAELDRVTVASLAGTHL